MKKILLIILNLFVISTAVNANNYSNYCSSASASKTFGGSVASITGVNFLSRTIIESKIGSYLKKQTNSKFNVNIDSFYGVNLLNGEFKSISAKTDNIQYGGFYFSDVNISSLCPYNHIEYKNNKLLFDENMVLQYSVAMTQDNINSTLMTKQYRAIIDKMNANPVLSSLIKIESSDIKIADDKLVFQYSILPVSGNNALSYIAKNIIKPLNINFTAGLKVNDGKVELCDFEINSISSNLSKYLSIINLFNPTSYNINIDKNNYGKLEIQNIKIANSKINFDGVFIINKNN